MPNKTKKLLPNELRAAEMRRARYRLPCYVDGVTDPDPATARLIDTAIKRGAWGRTDDPG